jgi:hypothetical protein
MDKWEQNQEWHRLEGQKILKLENMKGREVGR